MKYSYAAEKFGDARRILMLPHIKGEVESIFSAFIECDHGLKNINDDDLDDDAKRAVRKIEELLSYGGGADSPLSEGTYHVAARKLNDDQKYELSRAVDHLADWFDRQDRKSENII